MLLLIFKPKYYRKCWYKTIRKITMVIYRMICLNFLQTETKISTHYVKLTGLSSSFKFKKMRPRYVKQAANTRHQISSGQTVKNLETVIWIIPVASLCCVIQWDEVLNSTPLSQRSDTPFHIIVPEAITISSSTTFSVTGCDLHVIAMRIHIKSQSVWCFVRWDIRMMWTSICWQQYSKCLRYLDI